MWIDHANGVSTSKKTDPVFLRVKSGMTVIIKNTDGSWRMADVVNVIKSAKSPKVPKYIQLTYVDSHVTNWVNADLVSHIVPRVWTAAIHGVWASSCTSECWRESFGRWHRFIWIETTQLQGWLYLRSPQSLHPMASRGHWALTRKLAYLLTGRSQFSIIWMKEDTILRIKT